jgi:hypothetical protein
VQQKIIPPPAVFSGKFRRIGALLGAAVLALGLAACGAGVGSDTPAAINGTVARGAPVVGVVVSA